MYVRSGRVVDRRSRTCTHVHLLQSIALATYLLQFYVHILSVQFVIRFKIFAANYKLYAYKELRICTYVRISRVVGRLDLERVRGPASVLVQRQLAIYVLQFYVCILILYTLLSVQFVICLEDFETERNLDLKKERY